MLPQVPQHVRFYVHDETGVALPSLTGRTVGNQRCTGSNPVAVHS